MSNGKGKKKKASKEKRRTGEEEIIKNTEGKEKS